MFFHMGLVAHQLTFSLGDDITRHPKDKPRIRGTFTVGLCLNTLHFTCMNHCILVYNLK